jgi:hypothetical protein
MVYLEDGRGVGIMDIEWLARASVLLCVTEEPLYSHVPAVARLQSIFALQYYDRRGWIQQLLTGESRVSRHILGSGYFHSGLDVSK